MLCLCPKVARTWIRQRQLNNAQRRTGFRIESCRQGDSKDEVENAAKLALHFVLA